MMDDLLGAKKRLAARVAVMCVLWLVLSMGNPALAREARILQEATARRMQSTLHSPDPRLLGTAYGIFDLSDNGQRTLGHQGYAPPMHSQLLLLPDRNLGVYVVFNSAGAGGLTSQHQGFQRAFFDHYFSAPAVEPIQPPADFAERAGRFTGVYRNASAPHSTLIKIIELFGGYSVGVSDPGDGTLLLDIGGFQSRFAEAEPLYFRQVDGPFHAVFREDEKGRITRMDTDLMPQYTNVKVGWYETPRFHLGLLLACVLASLSMIAAASLRALHSRRLGDGRAPVPRGARSARRIILGICVVNLLFLVGVVLWGRPTTELGSISALAKAVLGLGVLSALLTVGALFYTVLAWKDGYWGLAARAHYTLVAVAAVAFVWFLDYWNLLGWRY